MSNWLNALRALEPGLVCRCGLRNSTHIRNIRIVDSHGHAQCSCGESGPVQQFQEEPAQ
jgi:hypothetical protein